MFVRASNNLLLITNFRENACLPKVTLYCVYCKAQWCKEPFRYRELFDTPVCLDLIELLNQVKDPEEEQPNSTNTKGQFNTNLVPESTESQTWMDVLFIFLEFWKWQSYCIFSKNCAVRWRFTLKAFRSLVSLMDTWGQINIWLAYHIYYSSPTRKTQNLRTIHAHKLCSYRFYFQCTMYQFYLLFFNTITTELFRTCCVVLFVQQILPYLELLTIKNLAL